MSQGLSINQTWTGDAAKLRKQMHAFIMAVNQCHFTFCLLDHLTHAHAKYGCSGLHFCSELMSI